jgi:putative transposase
MGRPPLSIDVSPKDQKELASLLSGGVQQVRVVLRALALLQLAKGASAPRISDVVPLTPQAVRKIGHRYRERGLDAALYERQRPGAAAVLDDSQKQRIIAMVCSNPPEGRARWTVRLVVEEAVKRKLVPHVGRETIRILLLAHDLKPWREKMWWCAGMNRHGVEDARASRERSSDPLGPEFCAGRCEVSSEA